MPIYEYECEKCACRFELKRRFDEDAGSPCCPQCQGKVLNLRQFPLKVIIALLINNIINGDMG